MKCPRDNHNLEREVFCGVEIDSCGKCNGTWLDKGEMGKVIGMVKDLMGGEEISMERLPDREPGREFKCPRCENRDLEPFHFSYQKKIIIDKCPACEGIWLDGGELRQAVSVAYKEYGAA